MRLVFMGTPDYSVPTLRALVREGHKVVGVFTQPDRPAGRGKNLRPSPVKVAAEGLGLSVFQPTSIKTPESIQLLKDLAPESIIVVAYGQILSKDILQIPLKGCINVHASLLPAYRGAAPIHWALMNGETLTGVTTMLMDEGLDTGDMLLKREFIVSDEATTGEVYDQLATLGAELLIETLRKLQLEKLIQIPQTGETNYAPLLKREHERIDWSRSAVDLHHQIRGLNPWPGAYTIFREENLKLWRSSLYPLVDIGAKSFDQGEIIQVIEEGLLVQTGGGILQVWEVQPAGKRRMSAKDFFMGRHGQTGERFG